MAIRSFMKTAAIATSAGLLATVATLSLTTSAPGPAAADTAPSSSLAAQSPGTIPSLAPMLKTVLPAVVNISVSAKAEAQAQNPLLNDPFFRRFFEGPDGPGGGGGGGGGRRQQQPEPEETQAIGSGVIVDAAKGYVLTNNHVVEHADKIVVRLSDDSEYTGKLIGKDPDTDLAVLQIKGTNLKALPIADSDKLEVGDFVAAIGSPFSLRQTVTFGIVSALGRQNNLGGGGGYENFIQTDASINPGNSGGALVNLRGELVGINSQILSGPNGGGNIGIGFAIPTSLVLSVMSQLIETGSVTRGRIGIQGGNQELTPELAKALKAPGAHGALIGKVLPGSPAEKAGIKEDDIVVEANGKPVKDFLQLRYMVGLMRVGDKVELKLLREGRPMEVTVVIAKATDDVTKIASTDDLHPGLKGATFGALTGASADAARAAGVKGGVQVVSVEPRSAAARSGFRAGDVILSVNRAPVGSVADFHKLASVKDAQLLLKVLRGQATFFAILDPNGVDPEN